MLPPPGLAQVDAVAGRGHRRGLCPQPGELLLAQVGHWRAVGAQHAPPGRVAAAPQHDLADVARRWRGRETSHVAVGEHSPGRDPPDHGEHALHQAKVQVVASAHGLSAAACSLTRPTVRRSTPESRSSASSKLFVDVLQWGHGDRRTARYCSVRRCRLEISPPVRSGRSSSQPSRATSQTASAGRTTDENGGFESGVRDWRRAVLDKARRLGLRTACYRLLGDHGEAEDVVQETFLKLDGHPVLDRPDEEVAAWLRRVCLNASYNRLRGQRRATARLDRAGRLERVDDEVDEGGGPLLDVLRAEEQRAVRRALAALPERQRACLLLRHAGFSYAEVAATLDLAVGSVGVLLARGERAFRDAYLANDDADPGAYDALP